MLVSTPVWILGLSSFCYPDIQLIREASHFIYIGTFRVSEACIYLVNLDAEYREPVLVSVAH